MFGFRWRKSGSGAHSGENIRIVLMLPVFILDILLSLSPVWDCVLESLIAAIVLPSVVYTNFWN